MARAITSGVKYLDAPGNSSRQYRSIPNVPTLSSTPTRSTAEPGVASAAASGSQVWNGNSGAFTAKATKKPRNSALARPALIGRCPLATAFDSVMKSNVGEARWSPEATYSPISAASMNRPPNRLYSRNFTAAYER